MLLIWIFAGVLAGTNGQVCPNISRYNDCGQEMQRSITSVTNPYALSFEALNYICWNGTDTVTCFLEGLQACPSSDITFKSGFAEQQWDVSLIRALLVSGCQSLGAQDFRSNFGCMQKAINTYEHYACMSQAVDANPLGVNKLISCGLRKKGISCITTYIGGSCANRSALDFFLKWYYIQGNFEPGCSGIQSLMMTGTLPLVGTIYIFLMLLR